MRLTIVVLLAAGMISSAIIFAPFVQAEIIAIMAAYRLQEAQQQAQRRQPTPGDLGAPGMPDWSPPASYPTGSFPLPPTHRSLPPPARYYPPPPATIRAPLSPPRLPPAPPQRIWPPRRFWQPMN